MQNNISVIKLRDILLVTGRGLVAAPKFPEVEFPTAKYQFGNLLTDGKPNPPDQWTWSLIPKLADDDVPRMYGAPQPDSRLVAEVEAADVPLASNANPTARSGA